MRFALLFPIAVLAAGCASPSATPPVTIAATTVPTAQATANEPLEAIQAQPLYRMQPVEAGRYIAWVHEAEPDLRKRIAAIGRKNMASLTA